MAVKCREKFNVSRFANELWISLNIKICLKCHIRSTKLLLNNRWGNIQKQISEEFKNLSFLQKNSCFIPCTFTLLKLRLTFTNKQVGSGDIIFVNKKSTKILFNVIYSRDQISYLLVHAAHACINSPSALQEKNGDFLESRI